MAQKQKNAISPTRAEDYAEWYQQVIRAADLAENSPVRGCMVIKPWGWGIWENIRTNLDAMFKATGHRNAYFPLFIPLSFLQKEAEHVEGFAKECAVVTHHRLESDAEGNLKPAGELEEPLVVRPTSETIIGATYAKWVQSYRDLPLLINQWANIVRWEMRPRLFLRTIEFLWQEGHTVHATSEEAWEETRKMLDVYQDFAEEYMAIPVTTGEKTASERFPGAVSTLCIEAMMQDRKALQAGTSHFLGQNFAKASEIKFQSREGKEEYAWTTSWGVSSRLIGAMIMTHSDDDGLILPPRLAPSHVVFLPIFRDEAGREQTTAYCREIAEKLQGVSYHGIPLTIEIDDRDLNAGERSWEWVKKGIPVRVEIGPRDMEAGSVFVGRRDQGPKERYSQGKDEFVASITEVLDSIQAELLERARRLRAENSRRIDSWDEFVNFFTPKDQEKPEIHGGWAYSHWCGSPACEEQPKEALKVTIRCIPFDEPEEEGACVVCGAPSKQRVIFGKSY
ncbi:MAG: proline--tRNA ligase [Planctomycetes bacterium]|nr:proline--tRNA ligase [Planctomycetota bacterium]